MKHESSAGKPGHFVGGDPCSQKGTSVMECIYAGPSVRCFRNDPIPEEIIRQILEAGRFAPCGGGGEPWRFGVIRDQQRKERLAEAARRGQPEGPTEEQCARIASSLREARAMYALGIGEIAPALRGVRAADLAGAKRPYRDRGPLVRGAVLWMPGGGSRCG